MRRLGPGGTLGDICTADLAGTPPHGWYCTMPCDEEASTCAEGTTCESTSTGFRCVPKSCDYLLPDGGPADSSTEAATDSGTGDASTDAPKEAATHDATSG